MDFRNTPRAKAGHDYALAVAAGEIPNGAHLLGAVDRYLKDLERPDSPWSLEPERAELVIEFVEMIQHVKGPLCGTTIVLSPWQLWIILQLFGWVDVRGWRRFRQATMFVPRGNGKSTILAAICLWFLLCDELGAPEVYSAAVGAKQARIIYEMSKRMIESDPDIIEEFNVSPWEDRIESGYNGGKMLALASKSASLDGLAPSLAVLDELASQRDAGVYGALLTALGKRHQPLLFSITTCTENDQGIGREQWNYIVSILSGDIEDDRYLGIIYHADDSDDPWADDALVKSNPDWGGAVQPENIRSIRNQARQSPAHEAAFKTRHLNVWAGELHQLFDLSAWDALRNDTMSSSNMELEAGEYSGSECYIGLDLSRTRDLTAIAYLFPPDLTDDDVADDDDVGKWRVFVRTYITDRQFRVMRKQFPTFNQWVRDGWLTVMPGAVIDYGDIESQIQDDVDTYDVQAICYDPWGASSSAQRVERETGATLVEVRQSARGMHEPTTEFQSWILGARIEHNGNPVLRWALKNTVGKADPADHVKPVKSEEERKIDPAVAVIMAVGQGMYHDQSDSGELFYDVG